MRLEKLFKSISVSSEFQAAGPA